ncbi:MAG: flavodoxin domain-containing protein, partial [Syntrophales bacterium]|nr:flavodoxin domain-containing protein [Syntrophales bacterium]
VVAYDTMWEGTRRMAEAVGNGMAAEGIPCKIFHMAVSDRNDVITEIFKSRAVVIGSPTLNQGLLPTIAPILEDIRGLRFQNKIGAAFGTYGWSGESVKLIEEHLTRCKIPVVCPGVRAKWQPKPADLENCEKMGREIAAAVKST